MKFKVKLWNEKKEEESDHEVATDKLFDFALATEHLITDVKLVQGQV